MRVQIKILPSEVILNEKQRMVLERLLNGDTYRNISLQLNISEAAVRQYAHRLYKKLKVANRVEAVLEYGIKGDNKS